MDCFVRRCIDRTVPVVEHGSKEYEATEGLTLSASQPMPSMSDRDVGEEPTITTVNKLRQSKRASFNAVWQFSFLRGKTGEKLCRE